MTTRHHRRHGATGLLLLIAMLIAPVASFAEEVDAEEQARKIQKAFNSDPDLPTHSGSDATDGSPPLTIRTSTQAWEFGYHGYFRAPLNISFDKHPVMRNVLDNNGEPQRGDNGEFIQESAGNDWRFNMPHAVPDSQYIDWKYTNNINGPWAEMIFSYGNSVAVGHVSVASWNITDSSWRKMMAQLGINQAWVTLSWPRAFGALGGLKWNVGIFDNRYGNAGRWDAGRYDTYIVGRTHIGGETLTANIDLTDKLTLYLEHGFGAKTDVLRGNAKGQLEGASPEAGDNSYAWVPYQGEFGTMPAMVNHGHIGILHTHRYWRELWFNLHIMHVFSNSANTSDNRTLDVARERDGKYLVLGAEVKFNGALFGDFFLGYSNVKTDGLGRMPDAIELLHSQGGWNFLKNYYGDGSLTNAPNGDDSRHGEPNPGTGVINTLEWQYQLSVARLLWGLQDKDFWGQGPDLQVSFWGMMNFVDPDNKLEPYLFRFARKKLKFGTEAMYTPHKYVGVGIRFDRVIPDLDYDPEDEEINASRVMSYAPFSVLTPKLRIKTAFVTHEEVNIMYARYFWDDEGRAYDETPAVRAEDPYVKMRADHNALHLSVNIWW